MLNYCEQAVQFLTYLECIPSLCGWSACSLTADIEENGTGFVVPVLVIDPVPLSEVAGLKEVEMIEFLCEVQCLEVLEAHLIIYASRGIRCEASCRSQQHQLCDL